MGYAKYVGRVGALAVALGIGSAIGGPTVAWADDVDASNVSAANATSTNDTSTPDGGTVGTDPPGPTNAPTTAPSTDAVAPSLGPPTASGSASSTSVSVSVGDSPTVTIDAQTNGSKESAAQPVVANPREPAEPVDHDNHSTDPEAITERPALQRLSANTIRTDVDSTPES